MKQIPQTLDSKHRLDLQGLRAVAIVLVIFAHTRLSIVPGGFVGVDVFFVLSGYLITGILLKELRHHSRITLLRFYSRRLKRLLPALIFMLVASSGIAIILLSGVEARSQLASAPFASTWTSNLYFAFKTIDYFNELAQRDLFLHTWSLGVEEQFYLFWPIMLLVFFKLGKALKNQTSKSLIVGLGLAFISSFIACIVLTKSMPDIAFYTIPSRIWQLSLGAMINFIPKAKSPVDDKHSLGFDNFLATLSLLTGLALIIGSAFTLHPNLPYPGYWAILPSFGAAFTIVAGHSFPKPKIGFLTHPFMVWTGDRSYSLYLWHWPIFTLGFSMGFQGQILPTICLILLSLLAAIVSFRLIEYPFWKGRFSLLGTSRILLLSLLTIVATSFGLHFILQQLPPQKPTKEISNRWRSDVPIIYKMNCDAWYSHAKVQPCLIGPENAEKIVVLLGDSVGVQWFSIVPGIFNESKWRTIVLTKSSCPIVDEEFYYKRIGKIYDVCTTWRNSVLNMLEEIKPDVVFIGSTAGGDQNFNKDQWIEGSTRVLKRLSKIANSVFIIPGTPTLGFDGPGCISRNLSPNGEISSTACLAENRSLQVQSVTEYLSIAANRFPNVHLLDLNDLVCPSGNCNAITKNGVVVYRDSQHLTDSFVRAQIPSIKKKLEDFDFDFD